MRERENLRIFFREAGKSNLKSKICMQKGMVTDMSRTENIENREQDGISTKQDDTNKERPFGMRDKIGYMFGDFGNDFSFIFASSYLMVFYTKVLGISGFIVGLLFMAARVVDAFTDVTMGRIVDRLRPAKDGRFRPWIRRMCIPVAVASTIMYLYFVKDWAYGWKIVYMVVTYLLWGSFCYTAINIPYGSMASVISSDPGEGVAVHIPKRGSQSCQSGDWNAGSAYCLRYR